MIFFPSSIYMQTSKSFESSWIKLISATFYFFVFVDFQLQAWMPLTKFSSWPLNSMLKSQKYSKSECVVNPIVYICHLSFFLRLTPQKGVTNSTIYLTTWVFYFPIFSLFYFFFFLFCWPIWAYRWCWISKACFMHQEELRLLST